MIVSVSIRLPNWGISLIAGVTAAVAFLAAGTGMFGFILANIAPLPLMIAALGWGASSGAVAMAFAAILIMVLAGFGASLAFAGLIGAPALILAVLAQWRSTTSSPFYPLPRLMAWVTWVGVFASMIDIAIWIGQTGSFDAATTDLATRLIPGLKEIFAQAPQLPAGVSFDELAKLMASAVPLISTALEIIFLCFNLWAAARITLASGQLSRPFPSTPDETRLSPDVLGVMFFALFMLGASLFIGSTSLALAAGMILSGIGTAYAMQGLAVLHSVTRAFPLRGLLLTIIYIGIVLFSLWPLIFATILGLVDALHPLRKTSSAGLPHP